MDSNLGLTDVLRGYSHILQVQYFKTANDSLRPRNFQLMIHYGSDILRSIYYATEKRRKIPPKTENPAPVLSTKVAEVIYTS